MLPLSSGYSSAHWSILVVVVVLFRKDDWPDKRMAMDDRYGRSDFGRYQDFDHRERGRYQDDMMMDRRDNTRNMGADRDGQVRTLHPPPRSYSVRKRNTVS